MSENIDTRATRTAPRRPRRHTGKKGEGQTRTILSTSNEQHVRDHNSTNMLGPSNGSVAVHGGEFSAIGGSHISVTINAVDTPSQPPPRPNKPRKRRNQTPTKVSVPTQRQSNTPPSVLPDVSSTLRSPMQSIPVQRSCDIYYQHLAPKGRGSPLWIPEPNKRLPVEYQRTGMRIGDVGIITSRGSFDFLFNVCLPKDHPINPEEMPEEFEQLVLARTDIQEYCEFKEDSFLSSASIKKSRLNGDSCGLTFETSASEGAILTIPVGCNSEDVGNVTRFRKYAAKHAKNWYRYVNNVRGREAKNGDVRLVVGHDKTSAWGMATFSNTAETESTNDPFHLRFRAVESAKKGTLYNWEYSGMAEARAGPDLKEIEALRMNDPNEEGKQYGNQCLFVRTLNVMLQNHVWQELKAEFEYVESDLDEDYSGNSEDSMSMSPRRSGYSSQSSFGTGSSYGTGSTTGTSRTYNLSETTSTRETVCLHADNSPSGGITNHPSTILNEFLLSLYPHANMAITEDRDWIALMKSHDPVLPSSRRLRRRIMQDFIYSCEGGVAFAEQEQYLHTRNMPLDSGNSLSTFLRSAVTGAHEGSVISQSKDSTSSPLFEYPQSISLSIRRPIPRKMISSPSFFSAPPETISNIVKEPPDRAKLSSSNSMVKLSVPAYSPVDSLLYSPPTVRRSRTTLDEHSPLLQEYRYCDDYSFSGGTSGIFSDMPSPQNFPAASIAFPSIDNAEIYSCQNPVIGPGPKISYLNSSHCNDYLTIGGTGTVLQSTSSESRVYNGEVANAASPNQTNFTPSASTVYGYMSGQRTEEHFQQGNSRPGQNLTPPDDGRVYPHT